MKRKSDGKSKERIPSAYWQRIRDGLRNLRQSPRAPGDAAFQEKTRLHSPTIQGTEEGSNRPDLDTIYRWVTACSTTLGEFFSSLDQTKPSEPAVVLGYEKTYKTLAEILSGPNVERKRFVIMAINSAKAIEPEDGRREGTAEH